MLYPLVSSNKPNFCRHPGTQGVVTSLLSFLLFAAIYYAPLVFGINELQTDSFRLKELFQQAFGVPAIRFELGRNILGHLIPLALYYFVLTQLAREFSSVTRIAFGVSHLLFLVAGWLLLVAANPFLFPLSHYAPIFGFLAQPVIIYGLSLLLAGVAIFTVWRIGRRFRSWRILAGTLGMAGLMMGASVHVGNNQPPPQTRNVIIIGVDSLSPIIYDTYRSKLPHLASLLDEAIIYRHAYTPLARTFPAWMSLLSGKSPADHGAIFNLRNMEHVTRDALLPHTLHDQGYRTIFAIDERRFANIDESFGFDRVVGPKVGILDFLLQNINDTPLTNLLLQTRFGRYGLPFTSINAASHVNYDADAFVNRTVAAASGAKKLFLAIHFESAHFPFMTRHAIREIDNPNVFISHHVAALTTVDHQIGLLMSQLAADKHLDDALVLVLSDHGESLGGIEAQTTRGGKPFVVSFNGHGVDLLSEHQNRIVLGLIRFRDGHPVSDLDSVSRDDLVSLTDIRPAVERFVASGKMDMTPASPCMFVETGIRFRAASNYQTLNPAKLAAEGASYYEVDSTGRMRLRESTLPALIEAKDVGLRCRERLTFYAPHEGRYFAYKLDASGQKPVEIKPKDEDVAKINMYRNQLIGLKY